MWGVSASFLGWWKPFTKYILTPKYAIPPTTPHPIIIAWVTNIMLNYVPLKSAATHSNIFQIKLFCQFRRKFKYIRDIAMVIADSFIPPLDNHICNEKNHL